MGSRLDVALVRRLHDPSEELQLQRLTSSEYLLWLIDALQSCEVSRGLVVVGPQCQHLTHLDRLFAFLGGDAHGVHSLQATSRAFRARDRLARLAT